MARGEKRAREPVNNTFKGCSDECEACAVPPGRSSYMRFPSGTYKCGCKPVVGWCGLEDCLCGGEGQLVACKTPNHYYHTCRFCAGAVKLRSDKPSQAQCYLSKHFDVCPWNPNSVRKYKKRKPKAKVLLPPTHSGANLL